MQEILDDMRRDSLATVTRCRPAEWWSDFWKRQRRAIPVLDPEFDGPAFTLTASEYHAER